MPALSKRRRNCDTHQAAGSPASRTLWTPFAYSMDRPSRHQKCITVAFSGSGEFSDGETAGPVAAAFPSTSTSFLSGSKDMIPTFADPFDLMFNLQRALDARVASDWLQGLTASQGGFPPINVFAQAENILAIVELPGVDKDNIDIQAKENTIRISGKKLISYPENAS